MDGGSRAGQIRRRNLSSVARQIHRHGALSRAELTARLGLNRSTIGALVGELCELGVLTESLPRARSGAGRPSHMVGPAVEGPYVVAADLDIDRLVVAAVGLGGSVLARQDQKLEPDPSPEVVAGRIGAAAARFIEQLTGAGWLAGVGVSVPGTVTHDGARVKLAPNLNWRDVDFGALVDARLPHALHAHVGNDADLGVRAEHLRGAARSFGDVLYVHGRVGIGGGIICDGRALHGSNGFAGEIGHMVVQRDGIACHCGSRGCLETVIGEQRLLELAGRSGDHTAAVTQLLAEDDPGELAVEAITTVCGWLGFALAGAAAILNPQVIVLGGYLAALADRYGQHIRASFDSPTMTALDTVIIRAAGLGADSAVLGAAELAFDGFLADPTADPSTRNATSMTRTVLVDSAR